MDDKQKSCKFHAFSIIPIWNTYYLPRIVLGALHKLTLILLIKLKSNVLLILIFQLRPGLKTHGILIYSFTPPWECSQEHAEFPW